MAPNYLIGNNLIRGNVKSTTWQEQTWPRHLRIQAATSENSQADIALSDSLVSTARQQLYLEHLWAVMLPKDHHFLTESRLSAPGWSGLVLMFYNTEPSLRYVTLAMAMACLATENNDEQLRLKSLQTYSSAVQKLGSALKQRQAYQRNGLIVASGLMASFELVFVPMDEPRVVAWKHHTGGQLAFFLSRGPKSFLSGAAHQLFVDSRINMAMLAIGTRTRSPFSSHEWKNIPWGTKPKSAKDRLVDIMLEIPTLLEQIAQLQSSSCPAAVGILQQKVLGRCAQLERAMRVWAAKMGTGILRFDYTFMGECVPVPQTEDEFGLLHLSIVYWFIEMMLVSVKIFVSKLCAMETAEAMRQLQMAARKSARALPLLFASSGGLAQRISGLLALSIALRYFLIVEAPGGISDESCVVQSLLDRDLNGSTIRTLLTRMYGGQDPLLVGTDYGGSHWPENVLRWF
ncbi:fungal transcriptional regulatory protein [Metarhizium robertsii ARSEF 23]|uniref:Fungal transcriptional regulatory protein n=1 Tax=Metarhizium robertsii (strain ARSEF 23 / ATCC MYA-3075) TaxID=655844 RepID=E9F8S1_METRA|nr:fungal transcriptional regulatory protein [Metarhizium robertsii ARSEF 23]EFY95862.2 fungal transcriptional regulatory protein [Metarhizium robertsii ARSEF 23]